MGKAVVFEDALESEPCVADTDIDSFLLARPAGVYEVCRTLHMRAIVDYAHHVARLCNSLISSSTKTQHEPQPSAAAVDAAFRAALARTIAQAAPLLAPCEELRLTALLLLQRPPSPQLRQSPQLRFATMAERLPRVAGPVAAEVWRVGPRAAPGVKDSAWVRARAALKARTQTQPRVNEVLLQSADAGDGGALHEGLSSNFFAVRADGRSLQTAPLSAVLGGTVRALVLAACAALGVAVDDSACPSERGLDEGRWAAAFVTSTTRLVLEIDELRFVDDATGEPRRPPVRLPACPSPLVARIAAEVTRLLEERSVVIL